jgi:hypothetical protein
MIFDQPSPGLTWQLQEWEYTFYMEAPCEWNFTLSEVRTSGQIIIDQAYFELETYMEGQHLTSRPLSP